ncbi:SDR family NAD(P)-dependent oxidoreductase [Lewinella sp. IMCC34183]|uniref:SDR family NAD(P)-dependent oxidoreductase n=1 Tax=Lewinella sp. IMCC34183 TaxID=2248762 RepID=UPI000E26E03D|nr:SDR family oxidoreductase [Lewinella sp. IMCC34183]
MRAAGLITGASSGIGRSLAREHARRGRDVVIVARREDELEELASELRERYGVTVQVYVKDLTEAGARQGLFDFLEAEGIEIDYLFNNAGFGGNARFSEQDWSTVSAMIELNVTAVTELLHLFLPGMKARGRGWILNTSSTAGFMPGPLQAVYFATKAYVNSLSKAVASEVDGTGVSVTVLCPGPVETEFADRAGFAEDNAMMGQGASPSSVARQAYTAMEAGRLEVINELGLQVVIKGLLPLLPERLVMSVIKRMQS